MNQKSLGLLLVLLSTSKLGAAKLKKSKPIMPFFALGAGAGIPEGFPLEFYFGPSPWFSLRAFYALPYRQEVILNMPSDRINKKTVIVDSEPYTALFDIDIGPQYGLDLFVHPLGDRGLGVFAGLSRREVTISGRANAGVIFKDTTGQASSEANSRIQLKADSKSNENLLRLGASYMFLTPVPVYISLWAGLTRPLSVKTKAKIQADLINPLASDPEESRADLGDFKQQKEQELELKSAKEVDKLLHRQLPFVGMTVGYRF